MAGASVRDRRLDPVINKILDKTHPVWLDLVLDSAVKLAAGLAYAQADNLLRYRMLGASVALLKQATDQLIPCC